MPPQQAHKSCFLMKPRGDGGQLLWISSENNNGFLRMSTRLALLERAFIWHCLKKSLSCHTENRILMERWAAIMSLSIPFFFFFFCPFVRNQSDNEKQQLHNTYSWKQLSLRARWNASPQKKRAPDVFHHGVLSHLQLRKRNHLVEKKHSQGVKREKKCHETKRGSFAAAKLFSLNTGCIFFFFFFCGFRPVDILVTRCRPNVGGETRREVCQPGSSDAVPCSSDVKDDQEW